MFLHGSVLDYSSKLSAFAYFEKGAQFCSLQMKYFVGAIFHYRRDGLFHLCGYQYKVSTSHA